MLYGTDPAGILPYNKNYYAPGHPVWNWHFQSIDRFYERTLEDNPTGTPETAPNREAKPAEIAADPQAWIATYGNYYYPTRYYVRRLIDPSAPDRFANVSNRGMAGSGEKVLITGLIISGGEPRNVVVRALGPSMAGNGVQQPAANPKIEVYSGSVRIATNADWKSDARSTALAQSYTALAPTHDTEAALLLTLTPGTYTLHGANENGTEGVVLLEAYDVDSTR